jgi:hypothetical protein
MAFQRTLSRQFRPDLAGRCRSGRSLSQPPTMLTVLTQTPAFVSGHRSKGYSHADGPTLMVACLLFPGCPDRQRRVPDVPARVRPKAGSKRVHQTSSHDPRPIKIGCRILTLATAHPHNIAANMLVLGRRVPIYCTPNGYRLCRSCNRGAPRDRAQPALSRLLRGGYNKDAMRVARDDTH